MSFSKSTNATATPSGEVAIRLGPAKSPETILVPKVVLTHSSAYFQRMFKPDSAFCESKESIVNLTTEDAQVFKNYLSVVGDDIEDREDYLSFPGNADKHLRPPFWLPNAPAEAAELITDYNAIARVYHLAGYLLDRTIQVSMAQIMYDLTTPSSHNLNPRIPTLECVWLVYEGSPGFQNSRDKLRVALIKGLIANLHSTDVRALNQTNPEALPEGFSDDMMVAFMHAKTRDDSESDTTLRHLQLELAVLNDSAKVQAKELQSTRNQLAQALRDKKQFQRELMLSDAQNVVPNVNELFEEQDEMLQGARAEMAWVERRKEELEIQVQSLNSNVYRLKARVRELELRLEKVTLESLE